MKQITPTETIEMDKKTYKVNEMPQNIQDIVAFIDDWRQEEADANSKRLMAASAINDARNTLFKEMQALFQTTDETGESTSAPTNQVLASQVRAMGIDLDPSIADTDIIAIENSQPNNEPDDSLASPSQTDVGHITNVTPAIGIPATEEPSATVTPTPVPVTPVPVTPTPVTPTKSE